MSSRIRLTPFDHFSWGKDDLNNESATSVKAYFERHLKKPQVILTQNGRSAIATLIEHLALQREDEVWIITTFDLPNVSSCVTSTVFNYCKPSRVMTDKTKLALIIHEFGVMHPDTEQIIRICKERSIQVAEDCAHTFLSKDQHGHQTGTLADWTIISFPKFYPVEFGGALAGPILNNAPRKMDSNAERDIRRVAITLEHTHRYAQRRAHILQNLLKGISAIQMSSPLHNCTEDVIPWFFPVMAENPEMYKYKLEADGIESCIWHGAQMICLPLHQFIEDTDIPRMLDSLKRIHSEE